MYTHTERERERERERESCIYKHTHARAHTNTHTHTHTHTCEAYRNLMGDKSNSVVYVAQSHPLPQILKVSTLVYGSISRHSREKLNFEKVRPGVLCGFLN
jgi:hypothetical protein